MKPIALLAFLLSFSCVATAQLESVFHEVYQTDDGTVLDYPAGCTTYRIYASLTSSDDVLTNVFALTGITDLYLGSEGNEIWNTAFGGTTGPELNAAFFGAFPLVEFDSVVTIGRANSSDPGGSVTAISTEPSGSIISDIMHPGDGFGPGLEFQDGSWFSTPDQANTLPQGADNRVLLAQITCAGDIAYNFNIQVLDGGIGGDAWRYGWEGEVGPELDVVAPEIGLAYPYASCCDATACNYDPDATGADCDDATCEYTSCAGCTDAASCNYDPSATVDDGSCTTDCFGCTDPAADNYDETATTDDGSCTYALSGCTVPTACNYNPDAVEDDGSCTLLCQGCTDPAACNYDPEATEDNGTCTTFCEGCMDAEASNYDPEANVDSGDCLYGYGISLEPVLTHDGPFEDGQDLTGMTTWRMYAQLASTNDFLSAVYGDEEFVLSISSTGTFWQSEFGANTGNQISPAFFGLFPSLEYDSWVTLGMESGDVPGFMTLLDNGGIVDSFEAGGPLVFNTSVGGIWFTTIDQPNGLPDADGRVLIGQFTTDGQIDYCVNIQVFVDSDQDQNYLMTFCGQAGGAGCTDDTACNFNPGATTDDGSCLYACPGCTDPTADNYDPNATEDDGSCFVNGCTDALACNYDADATADNGSCTYDCYGCTDSAACNFDPSATLDDGSCILDCPGCTDPEANNYDPGASVDDGSCVFITDYAIVIEPYLEHTAPLADGTDLTGMTTYRIWVETPDATDEMSAIYGLTDGVNLNISTTTSFWQSAVGGGSAEDNNPAFYPFFPSLEYDSYVSIGKINSEDPGEVYLAFAEGDLDDFEATGGNIDIIDGAVFCLTGSENALFNEDNRSLVAQVTTDGSVSACFGVQIMAGGDSMFPVMMELCAETEGCTDPEACNYSPYALADDGSCTDVCPGCTDELAENYDPNATEDDGSCDYEGCTDAAACNYDATATINDGSCNYDCNGCTDPAACNYDSEATMDNGTCCFDSCVEVHMFDSFGDGWDTASWQFATSDSEDDVVAEGSLATGNFDIGIGCLEEGCFFFRVTEGAFPTEISWEIHVDGVVLLSGTADNDTWHLVVLGESDCEAGCMDPAADNYDPDATIDFGCIYPGCTDADAENYDPTANQNDGTCIYELNGYVFYDGNTNGVYDSDGFDFGLAYQTVTLMPDNITVVTDEDGFYTFGTLEAGDYTLTLDTEGSAFPISTTPAEVELSVESLEDNTQIDFGVADDNAISAICVDFYPWVWGYPCNGIEVTHNICFRNMGSETISGVVEVTYDELFEGHMEVTPISFEDGNTVQMEFENLLPGQMFFYDLILITPSLDFMGEFLTSSVEIVAYDDEGEVTAYGQETLEMEVTCAYDPNDKMVFPVGYEEPHFVEPEAELEYLVRFQNTGNDTANVVIVRDTLSPYLDYSSFQLMANSHDVMTTIDNETGAIEFLFDNILLPDSNVNEPESHGLISYLVKPLEGLPHGTLIENTAHIFFDTNPAIVTNTTWNTIYICDESMVEISGDTEVCAGEWVSVEAAGDYIEDVYWEPGESDLLTWEYQAEDAGEFYVYMQADNPLCQDVDTLLVTVLDVLDDMSFTVTDNLLEASDADSWQWYLNGEPIEGATGQTYTATVTGTYHVEGFLDNGCGTASDAVEVIVTHIAELNGATIALYPNPAREGTWLETTGLEGARVEVLDARGRAVTPGHTVTQSRLYLDRSGAESGLYVVRLTATNGAVYTVPLMWK